MQRKARYLLKRKKDILTTISLENMLQDTYESISIDKKLKDIVEVVKKSGKNIFAVIDGHGRFPGIIKLNDIKQKLFQPDQFNKRSVKSLMKKPSAVLLCDQDMSSVMEKFDMTQSWYLPVLGKDGRFIGFISKTKLFSKYREVLSSHGDLYDAV